MVRLRKLLLLLGFKQEVNADLCLSRHFLLKSMLHYVICSRCLKLMQMALHCWYIQHFCVCLSSSFSGPKFYILKEWTKNKFPRAFFVGSSNWDPDMFERIENGYPSLWYKLHFSSLSGARKQITDEWVRPHCICWGHTVSLIAYELSLYICETAGGHYGLVGNNTLKSLALHLSCVYVCTSACGCLSAVLEVVPPQTKWKPKCFPPSLLSASTTRQVTH